jgi:uncharacterized protein
MAERHKLFIKGPAGKMQALWHSGGHPDDFIRAAVVCHPHPSHGGTMEDEIVASCSRYISEAGIEVLAFNFRGVQRSEGKYDGGRGERDDTLAAIDHLLQISSKARVGVVGFSFGAWVGLDAGNQHTAVDVLVGIAPVVSADFRFLQASSKRKLIVFAEHDQYTDELAMRAWLQSLSQPLETCFVPGVGHVFGDRVDTVGRKVAEFLSTNL